jgi:hypothetical protein
MGKDAAQKYYKFNLCGFANIKFTDKQLNEYNNVNVCFDDEGVTTKTKLVPIEREDKKRFFILVPVDLFEEVKECENE